MFKILLLISITLFSSLLNVQADTCKSVKITQNVNYKVKNYNRHEELSNACRHWFA